jgi:hypothetical protein
MLIILVECNTVTIYFSGPEPKWRASAAAAAAPHGQVIQEG